MRRICCAAVTAIITAGCVWFSNATGGSSSDPVVTLEYVNSTWQKGIISSADSRIETVLNGSGSSTRIANTYNKILQGFSQNARAENVAGAVLTELQKRGRYLYNEDYLTNVSAIKDDVYTCNAGAVILIRSGSAEVYGGLLIDITKGLELVSRGKLNHNTAYMFPENGASVRILSESAGFLIEGSYGKSTARYKPKYYDMAYALNKMGLVRGAARGMELYRANTRAESVTMLIRLLAEERDAVSGKFKHPFKDIAPWAEQYIGFAFDKGYANGVAVDRFDSAGVTSANHYMTFILRALGYDDIKGDFKWDNAMNSAVNFGVITAGERDMILGATFLRDQMIYLSYRALFAKLAHSDSTLLDKLVESGAVNKRTAEEAINSVGN